MITKTVAKLICEIKGHRYIKSYSWIMQMSKTTKVWTMDYKCTRCEKYLADGTKVYDPKFDEVFGYSDSRDRCILGRLELYNPERHNHSKHLKI